MNPVACPEHPAPSIGALPGPCAHPSGKPSATSPCAAVIGLLGDSTLAADYLPPDLRPEALLARRLAVHLPDRQVRVVNLARSGEFAAGLALSGRYGRDMLALERMDAVIVRYGQNDRKLMEPKTFAACLEGLCDRLAADFPGVALIPETGLWFDPALFGGFQQGMEPYWRGVRGLASARGLPLSDVAEAMRAALAAGRPDLYARKDYTWDGRCDWKRHLPGNADWFVNKHPNLAGLELAAGVQAQVLAQALPNAPSAGRNTAAPAADMAWARPRQTATLLDWTATPGGGGPPAVHLPPGRMALQVEARLRSKPSPAQAASALRLTAGGQRLWVPPLEVFPGDGGLPCGSAMLIPRPEDQAAGNLELACRLPADTLAGLRITRLSWES